MPAPTKAAALTPANHEGLQRVARSNLVLTGRPSAQTVAGAGRTEVHRFVLSRSIASHLNQALKYATEDRARTLRAPCISLHLPACSDPSQSPGPLYAERFAFPDCC